MYIEDVVHIYKDRTNTEQGQTFNGVFTKAI